MLGATKYTDHFNKESIDYRKGESLCGSGSTN